MSDSNSEDQAAGLYRALQRLVIHKPLPVAVHKSPEKPWWEAADEEQKDPLGPDFTGGLGR